MTDEAKKNEDPIEEATAIPEVPEKVEETPKVPEDAQEEAPTTDPVEETPEEEKPEEDEPEVSETPELRITHHTNGQILVAHRGVRLSNRKAVAVLGAKGFTDLIQVVKSNRIKAGKTWEGSMDDLKPAPQTKKKK